MFGYVTPLKSELKVKEFEYFRSYYCGLCNEIKNQFGNIPRFCLNYDLTFIGFMLDGLFSDPLKLKEVKCIRHPGKKLIITAESQCLNYCADLSILLFDYKLKDNIEDDKSIKSKLESTALSPYKRKFNRNVTKVNDIIEENLNLLSNLEENKNFESIDEISHPFSLIVAKILELYPENFEGDCENIRYALYDLGYALGKWIYLIDALDDLKEDMEKNKFNPINFLYNKENKSYDELMLEIKPRMEFTILNCGYNCKESLDKLPLKRNKAILENIISLGMMDKYERIVNNCSCKEKGNLKFNS